MGLYLNPGNIKFREAINSEIYVDKTALASYTNAKLFTRQKFLCISRPRRFGKSMAAEMLCAYYDRSIDSSQLFAPYEIAQDPSYEEHRNRYNVLSINMVQFISRRKNMQEMIQLIEEEIIIDLKEEYSDVIGSRNELVPILQRIHQVTDIPFIILIDEWDCIFREHKHDKEAQDSYLDFLRYFLKDQAFVALAYMTGILPVKKYGTHSALNMFREFSMENPEALARFVGFTQAEVDELCERYDMDKTEVAAWYNGYSFPEEPAVYAPLSVVECMLRRDYGTYWTQTETWEALKVYIDLNFDGLKDAVIALITEDRVSIEDNAFQNDMVTFSGYRDVLALLVHLGYLGYNRPTKEVFIPNKEIADEFRRTIKTGGWDEVAGAVSASKELLNALWQCDTDSVALGIEQAHLDTAHLTYNNENALSYTLSLALYAAREYYTIIRELPAGKGFADLAFIPRLTHPEVPALLVELKWDKSATTALTQIREKHYPEALVAYSGNILLVGITYDKTTREHTCLIEQA